MNALHAIAPRILPLPFRTGRLPHSPTVLIARTGFWLSVVLGFVIGISAFNASYSSSTRMSTFLLPYLTHSVGAIILLVVGNIIARFFSTLHTYRRS